MAEFYDISNWNEKPWYQTRGTRSKMIVENPNTGKWYYFKTSLKKQKIDYKFEFWSEIIASEVGALLGFDMLKYDIAFNSSKEIGCLAEFMITEGVNTLTEGINYLTGYNLNYNPEDKNSKREYTFQFIEDSLNFYNSGQFIDDIIKIIILDSIISNGDRHQENWGILTSYNDRITRYNEIVKKNKNKKDWIKKQMNLIIKRKENENVDLHPIFLSGKFSQIYDSGSCLGRELNEVKIKQMLSDTSMMESYIRKGQSEIHWEGQKLDHFKLIEMIKIKYSETVKESILKVKKIFEEEKNKMRSIVEKIDINLPSDLSENKLPNERKEFIIKLLTLRIEKLIKLVE